MLITDRKNLKTLGICRKNFNFNDVPRNRVNVDLFNDIFQELRDLEEAGEINRFEWTDKLYPAKKSLKFPCWNYCCRTKSTVELIVFDVRFGGVLRIVEGALDTNTEVPIATFVWREFKDICEEEFNVSLDDMAVSPQEGLRRKETMEKAWNEVKPGVAGIDKVWDNAHHIDFHSSHPAGLANTHPELRRPIEYIYNKRTHKENDKYKQMLNIIWGYSQSHLVSFQWSHLAADAIADTNRRLRFITDLILEHKGRILSYNTDGVWYQGDIVHGYGEGSGLGEWENDHTNCVIRFKGPKSYEYIEDGEYHIVQSGITKLDRVKPREEWRWGDLFAAPARALEKHIDPDLGIIYIER